MKIVLLNKAPITQTIFDACPRTNIRVFLCGNPVNTV